MKYTMEDTGDGDFLTLPADAMVQVQVESIEKREVPGTNGREGWEKLNFRFRIVELPTALEEKYSPLIGSTIFGSVAARLTNHPDNKLRQWAEALLDMGELEAGFELDTDMLVGRKARGQVGHWFKRDDPDHRSPNQQIVGLLALVSTPIGGSNAARSIFGDDEPPF